MAKDNVLLAVSDDDLVAELVRRAGTELDKAATAFAEHVNQPANVEAAGLIFNRPPAATDPTTGQPVAASHPVLDALKTLLTGFVNQAGPTLTPLLMNLITQLLQKASAGTVTTTPVTPAK